MTALPDREAANKMRRRRRREAPLVRTGFQFGLAWAGERSGDRESDYTRLVANGVKVGADIPVASAAGDSRMPSLAWTGVENGLAWSDYRDGAPHICFTRLSIAGVRQTDQILVSDADLSHATSPSVHWSGSEWGVAWCGLREDLNDRLISSRRLQNDGARIGAESRVGDVGGS